MEEGELREAALGRELAEELGIVVRPPIGDPVAVLSAPDLSLTVYVVRNWVGDPVNRVPEEHDEIRWFDVDEVRRLRLALPALPGIIDEALTPTLRPSSPGSPCAVPTGTRRFGRRTAATR